MFHVPFKQIRQEWSLWPLSLGDFGAAAHGFCRRVVGVVISQGAGGAVRRAGTGVSGAMNILLRGDLRDLRGFIVGKVR